jgi:aldehyde dehydrogenase (NAD+)
MREYQKFYIGGRWVEPSSKATRTFDVINPATEQVAGRIRFGEQEDVDRAVEAARKAFGTYSQTSREERVALLQRVAAGIEARLPDLAAAITEEMGSPKALSTTAQVGLALGHLQTNIEVLKSFEFDRVSGTSLVRRVPIGVCALITPWNWPLGTVIPKLLPPLATGCTVVLKPSEFAPFSAYILAEILDAAKVPPGAFNLIYGEGPKVGAALSSHPGVDMVSITGSTQAGTDVARNAASTMKRVHQEAGGKSPFVLLDDADLEKAVAAGVRFLMLNSGQTCSAPSRMLASSSRVKEVIAIAKKTAESLTVGPPETKVDLGPVVNEAQWKRVQGFIRKGIEEGATLVTGGPGRPAGLEKGYYVKPTIFADVTRRMAIAQEEIFGPVLAIQAYDDVDDAIAIANDTPYGLAAYVHSGSLEKAREVGTRIRAGQVYINGDMDLFDLKVPFGGCKMSGNGREWGAAGLEAFLEDIAFLGWGRAA